MHHRQTKVCLLVPYGVGSVCVNVYKLSVEFPLIEAWARGAVMWMAEVYVRVLWCGWCFFFGLLYVCVGWWACGAAVCGRFVV